MIRCEKGWQNRRNSHVMWSFNSWEVRSCYQRQPFAFRSISTSEVELHGGSDDYLPPPVAVPVIALSPSAAAIVCSTSISAPAAGPLYIAERRASSNSTATSGVSCDSEENVSRISRARHALTRSFSISRDVPPEGGTLGRRSRHSTLTRSSLHQTGTQSAYSSRDASPEKGFRFRKLSPYPAPPPSIMIAPTPPRTPRRSPIPGSGVSLMTSGAMTRLYEKLAAIERVETEKENGTQDMSESQAIVHERTGRVRILTKSVSVDSGDQEPQYVPAHMDSDLGDLQERRSSVYGRYAEEYEDVPISQTLPASIRIGELTITPGIEALTKSMTPDIKRASWSNSSRKSSQQRLDRTKFFENYPTDVKDLQQTVQQKQDPETIAQTQKQEVQEQQQKQEQEACVELEPQKTASKPFFFTSVKERRKMFS